MSVLATGNMLMAVCVAQPVESLDWKTFSIKPPDGLAKVAQEKCEAVFTVIQSMSGTGRSQLFGGFFVTRGGVGVCPLKIFCEPRPLEFRSHDGTALKQPKVLAVIGDAELVVLQFSHKPAAWVEFSSTKAKPGSWVAFPSSNKSAKAILGPVMSYHAGGDSSMARKDKRDRYELFEVLAPGHANAILDAHWGEPLLDREGKVVGIYRYTSGGPFAAAKSLRMACPVAGLDLRLDEIASRKESITIPIPAELHPYDPAAVDSLYIQAQGASASGDWKMALKLCGQLADKYPDSTFAQSAELACSKHAPPGVVSRERLAELSKKTVLDGAGPVTRSYDHVERGEAAMGVKDWATAEAEFKMAIALAPDGAGLSYANLGAMAHTAKRLDEAERYYRKAVELQPSRIDYFDELRVILDKSGKWEESDAISDRVFILEQLYSRR